MGVVISERGQINRLIKLINKMNELQLAIKKLEGVGIPFDLAIEIGELNQQIKNVRSKLREETKAKVGELKHASVKKK